MPLSFDAVLGFLDEFNLHYTASAADKRVVVPFEAAMVVIDLVEDGGGLQFRLPNVFNIRETPHPVESLACMLDHNYRVKIGVFAYDPTDGEVTVEHFLPIEDSQVTSKQFHRVVHALLSVHNQAVPKLRQAAFGKTEDAALARAATPELPDGLAGLLGDMISSDRDNLPDAAPYDPASLPAAPVDERTWLDHVCRAFAHYCRNVDNQDEWETMRREVWPRLLSLGEESLQAGETYLTSQVPDGLTAEDMYVVFYLLARQAAGVPRVWNKALDLAYSPGLDETETGLVVRRLLDAGVVAAADCDAQAPWVLSSTWLDPLTEVLPFEHTPLAPMVTVDDIPLTPCAERDWLRMAHRAVLASAAGDSMVAERLDQLRDELWPQLLTLRQLSASGGESFATLAAAERLAVSEEEELVVLFLAAQAAVGQTKVGPQAIDLLYSPGYQGAETMSVIDSLRQRELVRCTDDDNLPPYTSGPAAAVWQDI